MMNDLPALLAHSEQIERENNTTKERTGYVIKLTKVGAYVCNARTWTEDLRLALRFEFMTTALLVAIELLDLAPEDFDVVSIC